MLIRNVRLQRREGLWRVDIANGIISSIAPDAGDRAVSGDALDGEGGLAIPPFVEPHIHLDTALTAGQPRWNESGTLFEGIERWAERKQLLSGPDVRERAVTALKWQSAQGVQYVRTHVDVTDPSLVALKTMLEIKAEVAPWMELQIVAFPQEGVPSYPRGAELLEEALRLGADAVGGIPHYEFTREYGVASVQSVFDLAAKYDRLIDIHCDEIDDDQSRFVEVVAAEALRRGMGSRVTASHTTAMHSYNNAYTFKLFSLLKSSGINLVANPLVNIHLQGRFDTYPKRRGVTRVKELWDAGINVCFGHDDILDPWYPLGTGNMLQVLHMGLHACQIMGRSQLDQALDLITVNSARTLSLGGRYDLTEGNPANMVILPADSGYDALRRQVTVRYSLRNGRVIAETKPAAALLHWNTAKPEAVAFKERATT